MLLVVAGVACGVPRVRYYTLEVPHARPEGSPALGRHIAVQRFRADRPLASDRIVYRENGHEVNFYEYQRWANPPTELVTGYVLHLLKDGGGYARVTAAVDGGRSDFTLQGRIHRFEEVDNGKEVSASVALEAELVDSRTRASVWRGEAACTRPLPSRDLTGVVRGIHECLDETAGKLLASMRAKVATIRD
jgi:ABC-type uncharacterized transport system auxiliary subunit